MLLQRGRSRRKALVKHSSNQGMVTTHPSQEVGSFTLPLVKVKSGGIIQGYYIKVPLLTPTGEVLVLSALADTGSDFFVASGSDCKHPPCNNPTNDTRWPCKGVSCAVEVNSCQNGTELLCELPGSSQHFTYGDGDFEGPFISGVLYSPSAEEIPLQFAAVKQVNSGTAPNTLGLLPSSPDLLRREKGDRSFIGQIMSHLHPQIPKGYILDMKGDTISFGHTLEGGVPMVTSVKSRNGAEIGDEYFFLQLIGFAINGVEQKALPCRYAIIDTGTSLMSTSRAFVDRLKQYKDTGCSLEFSFGSSGNERTSITVDLSKSLFQDGIVDDFYADYVESGELGNSMIFGQLGLQNKILSVDLEKRLVKLQN